MYRIKYGYWTIEDDGKYPVMGRNGKYYGIYMQHSIESDSIKILNDMYIDACLHNDLARHTEIQFIGIEEF